MKTCAFLTLGCRVNQYETESVREKLLAAGFSEVPFEEKSDVYFINTCAVTGESGRKSRQMIRRALRRKEEDGRVIVCAAGCYTQGQWNEKDELLSRVDLLFGNVGKSRCAEEIIRLYGERARERWDFLTDVSREKVYDPMRVSGSVNARAFLKIQDGCNSFCSYCFVPLVRGRVRSRDPEEIAEEARRLAENGYREIVLTGIETGAYGEDREGKAALADLALRLARIGGVERIRFGSLKPTIFTEGFCKALASEPKIMPHFHLSLQSGSSEVLAAMCRRYGRVEEMRAVDRIRGAFPDAGLSADLIVGFPGETEAQYLETESLVREAGLLHTHIFPYSPRKGTAAAAFPDQIPEAVKRDRASRLLTVAKECSLAFAAARVGRRYRVLCERIKNGVMTGYTENFLYTATPVSDLVTVGSVVPVILEGSSRFSVETLTVQGKLAAEC